MEKSKLLSHLTEPEERRLGARIVELAERALRDETAVTTDFLDPREREVATGILGAMKSLHFRSFGGYRRAERQRIVLYPEFLLGELIEVPLTAVEVRGAFAGPVSHRDALGAVLGLGIERRLVGDILVQDAGFQVITTPEIGEYLLTALTRVGRTEVTVEEIDLERLAVEPERVKEIRTTVASMRLDAIAAAGFGTSRSKIAREIRAERVKVNWRVERDPAATLRVGDLLSMRGRGRVRVEAVEGESRKGRTNVVLKRFI